MGRLPRAIDDGLIYHALNRGNNGVNVFTANRDREGFLKAMGLTQARYPFKMFGYCLMRNHFHLLLQPEPGQSISRILQSLTVAHTWRYHKHHHSSGHVWQGRFNTLPTIFKSAPQGGANKRGRTDSIHDANLLYSNLDAFHQGTDDLSPFWPACGGQAGLHPLPDVLEAL